MTTTLTCAGYIVCDNEAIWGYGETEDKAWADMVDGMHKASIDVVDEYSDPDGDRAGETLASLFKIVPASAALIADVERRGGSIAWRTRDGIACTKDEDEV